MKSLSFIQICNLIILFVLSNIGLVFSAELEISDQEGITGDQVTFTVSISNIPVDIKAMEFTILYDTDALSFEDKVDGALVSDFDFFDAATVEGNKEVIKIVGFGSDPIAAGTTGTIAGLRFRVNSCQGTRLAYLNLLGDVKDFSIKNGLFTCMSTLSAIPKPSGKSVANFTADHTTGPAPLTVQFTDLSTDDPSEWLWDFGDGSTSTDQNPLHTYQAEGIFDVTLCIKDVFGEDCITKGNFITATSAIPKPSGKSVANFTADHTAGPAPLTVQFTDLSTDDPSEWLWDFGDGNTSLDQNPLHTYQAEGIFDVTLCIKDVFGEDCIIKEGFVTVTPKHFELKCDRNFLEWPGGIERLILDSGEDNSCILRLIRFEPGTFVEVSTNLRTGFVTSVKIDPVSGVTNANGEIEFKINAISSGIDWVSWAIANENGEFKFNKKAYDNGLAWGIFIEVR